MSCKVELRDTPSAYSLQRLISAFGKLVTEAGVKQKYKQHEFYESPGEKKRRKKKEAANQRLKAKLRENFPDRKFKKTKGEKSDKGDK